jgi:hypothetical protein
MYSSLMKGHELVELMHGVSQALYLVLILSQALYLALILLGHLSLPL